MHIFIYKIAAEVLLKLAMQSHELPLLQAPRKHAQRVYTQRKNGVILT